MHLQLLDTLCWTSTAIYIESFNIQKMGFDKS